MSSGIINICLAPSAYARTHVVLARPALTTDICVFSNGPANASLRLTVTRASSPTSRTALQPTPRPPEPRCHLLPALKSRAAASSSPPFKAARAAAAFQHSPPLSPERTTHPLLCHIRCTMSFNSINVHLSTQYHLTGR